MASLSPHLGKDSFRSDDALQRRVWALGEPLLVPTLTGHHNPRRPILAAYFLLVMAGGGGGGGG